MITVRYTVPTGNFRAPLRRPYDPSSRWYRVRRIGGDMRCLRPSLFELGRCETQTACFGMLDGA